MYGGRGHRPFYLGEINRIEDRHRSNLPESKLSAQEAKAGFGRLADTYGPVLTIIQLEEKTGLSEEQILTWSLKKFYYRIEVYAWQAETQRRYQEIMSPKKRK